MKSEIFLYILNIVILVIVFWLLHYLRSYFGKKGENIAKKEDLKDITAIVEDVKSKYHLKTIISEKLASKKLEVYGKIWSMILNIRNDVGSGCISLGLKRFINSPMSKIELTRAIKELRIYCREQGLYISEDVSDKIISFELLLESLDEFKSISEFIDAFNLSTDDISEAITDDLNSDSFEMKLPILLKNADKSN